MKQKTTILFLLLICNVYGQKWHLNRIDKNSKYKYEYWFQFQNLEDSCTFNEEKILGKLKSTIQLTDNKNKFVSLANITIKNLESGYITNLTTDLNGLGEVSLKPGKYKVFISAINYDEFTFDFKISENEAINLKVQLGLAPELDVYQINSKTELKEVDIFEIMKCVKENKQNFYENCSQREKFYITMQI
ncbi:MAG: carboxypeptidase-like regulatory domain-containing protein [Flavobacterium sp.]|uniref:carboxypeptidase-like regulatory domain-containing protein n=1 Tax=Flavobacterium sp. TaxID=239 RepID=UPI002598BE32|nr:carboxypeptidase-like regulatory domain-containing protein [uncultured Flavobacterium sp.]